MCINNKYCTNGDYCPLTVASGCNIDHKSPPGISVFLIIILKGPHSQELFWKWLGYVLVSCWCCNKSPQILWLETRQTYYCAVRWEVQYGLHWIKIKVHSFLEALGANLFPVHLGCWQNSVSCRCRRESPDFWLAINWGPLPASGGYCILWLMAPFFHLQSQQQLVKSFSHQIFLTHSASLSIFKDSCD